MAGQIGNVRQQLGTGRHTDSMMANHILYVVIIHFIDIA